ncbi:GNAT family N-acetyltransferase [Priestia megaterium]|uniref:GNAT family N-acetyltransferase n=1 Tax=Priestia megaterium TaxID=1404 RepID=A0A3D8X1H3_PRIMG|nr:GNAT family N-acetyltransferase [Priestia megaterium]MDH3171140.1 GNAT family N-acetyltransferase [Priestia megaterium]RDZ13435.1 GNAT family N-acetyltransferase [Priestia megaterium]
MSESIIIQPYTSKYQQQVVDLILHIQQQEYQIPITEKDQPDLFEIENFYQQGNGNFWVAVCNEKVVGSVALIDIGSRQVALWKMFVAKSYRGAAFKTAHRLLHTAIASAKEQEVERIYLGTTLQYRAAHRFYEKNGFQAIEKEKLPVNFPVMNVDKKFYTYKV